MQHGVYSSGRDWKILLGEWAVPFNHQKSVRVFGNAFSHPFLVLQDSGGGVANEIHGEWERDKYSSTMRGFLRAFHATILDEELTALAAPLAKKFMPPAIIHQTDERIASQAGHFTPLLIGPEHRIKLVWNSLREVMPEVNGLRLPFYQYATPTSGFANCQVMLRNTMDLSGRFNAVPSLRFAQTGWTTVVKPVIKGP